MAPKASIYEKSVLGLPDAAANHPPIDHIDGWGGNGDGRGFRAVRRGGYGYRKIGFGRKIGIVSVDFMNGVTNPDERMGKSPMAQDAVEKTAILLDAARARGMPIVHCNTAFQPDLSDMPPWKIECMKEWIIGQPIVEIDRRLWRDGDVLVCKKTPSIFFGTHCASVLNMHGVDTVIVTGANTSGCIRATAIDSFALGYRTIVPRECVFDQGPSPMSRT